jgi:type I restriction enzyme S subunit
MQRHQIAKSGQVILSEIWGKKGAIGFVPPEGAGALCTSHFFLFNLRDDRTDPGYLGAVFTANYLQEQLDEQAKGTTGYAAVRPRNLLTCKIPLPPLDEQRRIVARIEQLAAKIADARFLRGTSSDQAEALFCSAVTNLNFKQSAWTTLRSTLLDKPGAVRSGPFGSQLHHEEFVQSGIPAIGTRDVQVNRFALSGGWYVTPEKFEQLRRYQVFPGDVLVTIVGASIGRFCVVPDTVPLAFTTKHVQALTLDLSLAEPQYVSCMLNFHQRCRKSIFSQCEGSAQPSLNATKVLRIALPVTSLTEQRRIIAYLDTLQAKVDALSKLQAETAAELDALLPSILDKAFRGEL